MKDSVALSGEVPGASPYRHLLAEGRIGSMAVRNRMVHAPMSLGLGAGDGECGERFIAYYEARARGGVGLINVGTVSIGYPEGSVDARQVAISQDRYIAGIKELADRVQRHGARIMLQLNHNGLIAGGDRAAGRPLAAPSLPLPRANPLAQGFLPEELEELGRIANAQGVPLPDPGFQVLDKEGIARIVAMFAAAAERSRRAGVDAVEIHGGHGYLLSSFLSPASNRRQDEYGGVAENRARFLVETVAAVRAAVGAGFPIVVKLDSIEFGQAGGISLEDAIVTARLVEAAGADAITATGYADMMQPMLHSGAHTPEVERLLVPYAEAIRKAVSIPVLTAGRIEPEDADTDIAAGRYDFVAFGRKLLADPELPAKLMRGDPDAVRPCIYCYACISQAYFRRPVICAVNPEMGHEDDPPQADPRAGQVAVVGGGIAGMEAARRLARAGNPVTLIEQAQLLGGQARTAAIVHPPVAKLLTWLEREMAEAGVAIRGACEATPRLIETIAPDRLIVATGTSPQPIVTSRDGAQAVDPVALEWMAAAPGHVVVLDGGHVGLMLARFFVRHGSSVALVDSAPRFGAGLPVVLRWRIIGELQEAGAAFHAGASAIERLPDRVRFIDGAGLATEILADAVIHLPDKASRDSELAESLRAAGRTTDVIGDSDEAGFIWGAMHAAAAISTNTAKKSVQ